MTIGQKIKLKRESLSLSQEQLAHLLNTSRQTIYHWENDITSPNMNDLQKTCFCITNGL
ncbi:MAG: helix-turn-helix transcriptional regulator [Candidatus Izemoplasmatales bacterium]